MQLSNPEWSMPQNASRQEILDAYYAMLRQLEPRRFFGSPLYALALLRQKQLLEALRRTFAGKGWCLEDANLEESEFPSMTFGNSDEPYSTTGLSDNISSPAMEYEKSYCARKIDSGCDCCCCACIDGGRGVICCDHQLCACDICCLDNCC